MEATTSAFSLLIQQMDDIDAMFSEMLGEMDLLTQVSIIITHGVLHSQMFYLLSDLRMLVGGLVCLPSSTHFFFSTRRVSSRKYHLILLLRRSRAPKKK